MVFTAEVSSIITYLLEICSRADVRSGVKLCPDVRNMAEHMSINTVFPKINAGGAYFFVSSLMGPFILDRRLI